MPRQGGARKPRNQAQGRRAMADWDATYTDGRQAPDFGELQSLVDELFADGPVTRVTKLDALERAQIDDLGEDLLEVIDLLPSGRYARRALCNQLNSIITAHGWGYTHGTVS